MRASSDDDGEGLPHDRIDAPRGTLRRQSRTAAIGAIVGVLVGIPLGIAVANGLIGAEGTLFWIVVIGVPLVLGSIGALAGTYPGIFDRTRAG